MAEAAAKKNEKTALTPVPAAAASTPPQRDVISLVLLALVTVNLVALTGMGFFMQKMWGRLHEVADVAKKASEAVPIEKESKGLGKEIEPHKMGPLFSVDNILVNINSDQGPKFLQLQMEFELTDPAVDEELKKKKPIVRDAILVLLSSRNYKELREADGMTKLRTDLMRAVNSLLSSGRVKEIYFTQYHFN